MKIALCNEVLRDLPIERQAEMAAALGYSGLEIAPFTLDEAAWSLPPDRRAAIRRACANAGIAVSGLHWLLVSPPGLSITTADTSARDCTIDVMRRLIDLCADLGGTYLVHGSPGQRRISEDSDPGAAAERGKAAWAAIAADAAGAGVVYCIEPLARPEADFVTTVAEAAEIVRGIDKPSVRTMIDASAAARGEAEAPADLASRWLPSGLVAHIHLNDRNRRGPGQGEDRFAPLLSVLRAHRYTGWIGIEPFDYVPDGPTSAARAIGYVKGILEGQSA